MGRQDGPEFSPATVAGAIAVLCMALYGVGCSVAGAPAPGGSVPGASAAGLSLVATPIYRLVSAPVLLDSPSRLLAIQMRLAADEGRPLSVHIDDIALVMPNGEHSQVFDRVRAAEILHRTLLADADFSYLQRNPQYPPGGLRADVRPYLTRQVTDSLLGDTAYASGGVVQGFIVVDTGTPRLSLDGASLEVVAYCIGDAAPARVTYSFTAAPAATASR